MPTHPMRVLMLINRPILFPAEVISEETIFKWYKDAHSAKGKMHFLEQMKKFIEWLQNAEEGMYRRPI